MIKILSLTNHMRSCGEILKDQVVVEKVLRTLTFIFDHIVVAIEESKNLEEYKIEELQRSLETHELRLKERNPNRQSDQALQARFKFSGQWNKINKEKSHNSRWRSNDQGSLSTNHDNNAMKITIGPDHSKNSYKNSKFRREQDKKKVQCYNCRNYGDFVSECKISRLQKGCEEETRMTQNESPTEVDEDHCLLMATTKNEQENDGCNDFWYLDTSCSNHMTGRRDWFTTLGESAKSKVKFANNSSVSLEGVGKVMIKKLDGRKSYISSVLYVSRMKNNLLSLGQLLEK
ncbi:PREDICTED: uncharacterized protein LOC109326133 [Lupinus angustifolius]|uniref:uncharacterized protein LOC109326133 n=1 Tax=Lupinus angustifolius TaxID=3871 RepID=UPI00092E55E9|nr:PREDICTED: uncharacterized protein LOC109326133 [Lupinus angustifolius]